MEHQEREPEVFDLKVREIRENPRLGTIHIISLAENNLPPVRSFLVTMLSQYAMVDGIEYDILGFEASGAEYVADIVAFILRP